MVVEAAEDVVQSADEMEGSLAVDEERLQLAAGHDVHSARERDSQNRVNRTRVRACPVVITQSSQERVGIGGPVGSGKTALTLALCLALRDRYNLEIG